MKTTALVVALFALPCLAESVAGGVAWTAPANWKVQEARPMRAATYLIPAVAGDTEPAECAVFYFGVGQGGSVSDNIGRWVGQFQGSKPPTPKREKMGEFDVTTLELEGTYLSSMGGPMAPKTPKPGFKLLGGIVEAAHGPVFFKFTGPTKTVESARADFLRLLKSLKAQAK